MMQQNLFGVLLMADGALEKGKKEQEGEAYWALS